MCVRGLRGGALGVGITLALLAASTPAAAATKPIKGKLNASGYTVIALAPDGRAASAQANRGFKFTPPAKSVTLHLRGPDGEYAGPIVVGRKGKKAIVGVKAGAKLRKVRLREGYAKVAKKLPKKSLDKQVVALAENKVPIGAGNVGRVASTASVAGPDRDLDGVPGPLDIDDDGDLVLDSVDPPAIGGSRQQVLDNPRFGTTLELSLSNTVNVNAGSTREEIEETPFAGATEIRFAALFIGIPGPPAAFTELDCGVDNPNTPDVVEGIPYCRPGGTGQIFPNGPMQPGEDFPECCDGGPGDPPGGDGFGTLRPVGPNPAFFALVHGATTAKITAKQILTKRLNDAQGAQIGEFPSTVGSVFATVPALTSYVDGAGNVGTVSYEVDPGEPPPGPPGGPGTERNPFRVAPCPASAPPPCVPGDVVVTFTLWQPQRRPIEDELCPPPDNRECTPNDWIDIGGLTYSNIMTSPHDASGSFQTRQCPQDAYFIPPGEPFIEAAFPATGLTNTLLDRPTRPENKLTYTLNLTRCLGGLSWNSGETASVWFRASGTQTRADSPPGSATQTYINFELE